MHMLLPLICVKIHPNLACLSLLMQLNANQTKDLSTAAGHMAAGHTAAGEMAAGDMAAGHMAASHMAAGHMAAGHMAAGHPEAAQPQAAQLETAHLEEGHMSSGHTPPAEGLLMEHSSCEDAPAPTARDKTNVGSNPEAAAVLIKKRGGTRVSQKKRKRCRPKGSWGQPKRRGQKQSAAFTPKGSSTTRAFAPKRCTGPPGSPPGIHSGTRPVPHPGKPPGTHPVPNPEDPCGSPPGNPPGSPPVAAPSQPSGSPLDSAPTAAPRKRGRPPGSKNKPKTRYQESSAYWCRPSSRRNPRRTSTATESGCTTQHELEAWHHHKVARVC